MKKTIALFIIVALVALSLFLWAYHDPSVKNISDALPFMVAFMVVGFALLVGFNRIKSIRRKESIEDELSNKIKTKATSLSYYISIYLWLFIMYLSDKTTLEAHSLIGAGILGMAIIFLICWVSIKLFGIKDV